VAVRVEPAIVRVALSTGALVTVAVAASAGG
jgi:hypothetical protein